jgi:acyl-coenzyme A thioesterase 9
MYVITCRLDMLAPLAPVRDIRISGHVIHVGSSSMEIVVKMEALESGKPDTTLLLGTHILFTFSPIEANFNGN